MFKNNIMFTLGNNYLYEFKDNIREYELGFINLLNNKDDNPYAYFRFIPINCQMEIRDPNKYDKFQKDVGFIPNALENFNYIILRVDNKNKSCKFYAYTYPLDIKHPVNYMEAATISNNVTHYSIFNKEINKIKYFYPHTEIENNLMVNFTIKNETKDDYTFSVYINQHKIYNNKAERKNSLTFNNLDIAKNCKDKKQICNFYFLLETNNKTESAVEFKVISFYSDQKSENSSQKSDNLNPNSENSNQNSGNSNPNSENFLKKNLKMILIIAGGAILLLIIIILIICLFKGKQNSDLSFKINQISFEEERERENNKYDEELIS